MTIPTGTIALETLRLGWDSMLAGMVLGIFNTCWRMRITMAALFGICDGGAAVLGHTLLQRTFDLPDMVTPILFVALVGLAFRGRRGWLWLSPLLFSIDNFFSIAPPAHAPMLVCSSALLAWSGLCVGRLLRQIGTAAFIGSSHADDGGASRGTEHA
ncbi:hypothetical protein [Caballeronia sp. GAFFF1]|uniref:hypothetical protein n=1 Tax=Caballeronia sp. GAFFF1 TaxID=2921779 RepID=UPI002027C58A|nr:hypothetical protein [Caballeronia sp. GAFFF1]